MKYEYYLTIEHYTQKQCVEIERDEYIKLKQKLANGNMFYKVIYCRFSYKRQYELVIDFKIAKDLMLYDENKKK